MLNRHAQSLAIFLAQVLSLPSFRCMLCTCLPWSTQHGCHICCRMWCGLSSPTDTFGRDLHSTAKVGQSAVGGTRSGLHCRTPTPCNDVSHCYIFSPSTMLSKDVRARWCPRSQWRWRKEWVLSHTIRLQPELYTYSVQLKLAYVYFTGFPYRIVYTFAIRDVVAIISVRP